MYAIDNLVELFLAFGFEHAVGHLFEPAFHEVATRPDSSAFVQIG